MADEHVKKMGYRDVDDFYQQNPGSNFDVTPLTTRAARKIVKGVRYIGRAIKKKIKRYE